MKERRKPPHLWQKGQSGNPGGRAKLPEWLKDVKRLPNEIAATLWSKWLSMEASKLEEQKDNWQLSAMELGICRAILKDIKTGELRNIEMGLCRIIGKVADAPPQAEGDLSALDHEQLVSRVKTALGVIEMNRTAKGPFEAEESKQIEGVHLP